MRPRTANRCPHIALAIAFLAFVVCPAWAQTPPALDLQLPQPVDDGFDSGTPSDVTTRDHMNNDNHIQKTVQAELSWEPSITAAHIGVAAKDGVVTLTGHVKTYAEKHAAEKATGRVKGVKAVAEELEVRLPFETKRTDEEIAASAVDRLAWDVSVPPDSVQIRVEKGWVTMTGQVDWNFQKVAANQDLRRLFGVVGVSDQITIKPRVDITDLSDDITHALHRSWFFDRNNVSVTASGGKVTLRGSVPTLEDKQVAARTAWAAPGVTGVENDIAVI